jgi:hypothetical protein
VIGARQSVRHLALALGVGALAALLVDAVLQNALAAVRSPGASAMTPWWVIGRVLERSPWFVAALLAWLWAPALARAVSHAWPADHVVSRGAAFDVVGRAMIAAPLLWLVATWLVWAVKMTLVGSWGTEGRVFLAGYYYYNVLLAYTPWAGGGITLLALKRHVPEV